MEGPHLAKAHHHLLLLKVDLKDIQYTVLGQLQYKVSILGFKLFAT